MMIYLLVIFCGGEFWRLVAGCRRARLHSPRSVIFVDLVTDKATRGPAIGPGHCQPGHFSLYRAVFMYFLFLFRAEQSWTQHKNGACNCNAVEHSTSSVDRWSTADCGRTVSTHTPCLLTLFAVLVLEAAAGVV